MRLAFTRLLTTVAVFFATLVWADPPAPQCACGQTMAECQKTGCTCGQVADGGQCPLHAGRGPHGKMGMGMMGGPRGPNAPKDAPAPAKAAPAK